MGIYDWIQKTVFNTYEQWHMKSPIYNSKSFHIDGIDNSLKAMQDGYIMYTKITPPYSIKGCTFMEAVVGKDEENVNLYMEINGKNYCMYDLSYKDAVQIMRLFVKKSIVPNEKDYVEVLKNDRGNIRENFAKLSTLLLGNSKQTQKFLDKVKIKNMDDVEDNWYELYEELLLREIAIELSVKIEKDDFIFAIKKLSEGLELEINEDDIDEGEYINIWIKKLNCLWENHILAAMDIGSDTFVLMILGKENFVKAKELSRLLLQRIAAGEEM